MIKKIEILNIYSLENLTTIHFFHKKKLDTRFGFNFLLVHNLIIIYFFNNTAFFFFFITFKNECDMSF